MRRSVSAGHMRVAVISPSLIPQGVPMPSYEEKKKCPSAARTVDVINCQAFRVLIATVCLAAVAFLSDTCLFFDFARLPVFLGSTNVKAMGAVFNRENHKSS